MQRPTSYVDTNVTRHAERAAGGARARRAPRRADLDQRGLRHGAASCRSPRSHPLHGQSPYSATKIAADQMALSFHASFDMPVVVIRPFNTYGPRQSARAVIPTIITPDRQRKAQDQARRAQPDARFHLRRRHRRAAYRGPHAPRPTAVGQTINLGSGFEISIGDTARLIAEVMDTEIEIETDEAAAASRRQRGGAAVGRQRQGRAAARLGAGLRRPRWHAPRARTDRRHGSRPRQPRRYKADVYNV